MAMSMRRMGAWGAWVVLVAFAAVVGIVSPAQAVPGSAILGHRCWIYDNSVTNENTIAALRRLAAIPGASCEIDAWTLRDGTVIVWHDNTWGRVADHATLRAVGINPTDNVKNATWAQVQHVRTKGGEPVARLTDMIAASVSEGRSVPLIVEIRNSIPNPGALVQYARSVDADVRYYKLPTGVRCDAAMVTKMRNAGAAVGFKMPGASAPCKMTVDMIASRGASFVTESAGAATATFVQSLKARGVEVYARGAGGLTSKSLLDRGVAKLLVNTPDTALCWAPRSDLCR